VASSSAFQPYRQVVATVRKSKSTTAKEKDKRIKKGGRGRTVNAPKNIW
jgi:hypothetical protein